MVSIFRQKGFDDGISYMSYAFKLAEYTGRLSWMIDEKYISETNIIENGIDKINIKEVQRICQKLKKITNKYYKENREIEMRIAGFEQIHKNLCEIVAYSKQPAEASA